MSGREDDLNRIFLEGLEEVQGDFKRVLCVCAAGVIRSPTAAWVLSQDPYNFNTRSAGVETEYALIPVTDVLLEWAHEIVFMKQRHREKIERQYQVPTEKKIVVLDIDDDTWNYRSPGLVKLIRRRYDARG